MIEVMLPLSGLKFQNENSIVIPFEERYFAAPANMLCTVPMRLFTAAGFPIWILHSLAMV